MGLSWTDRMEDVSTQEWDFVLSRSVRPSPFLSRHFLTPWAKTFADGHSKRIYRWVRNGETGGFLFLCLCDSGVGWELLGGEQVSDSLDAIVVSGREEEFWTEFLLSSRDLLSLHPLTLPNLVEGSASIACLPRVCSELGFSFLMEEMDRSPYIPLPSSFEEYLSLLGGKERHELRRKIRRASVEVPGLFFRVTRTREEFERDFPSFVALHRQSHTGKAEFMDDRMVRFFREMAEGFLSAGRLRLAFLSRDGGDMASALHIAWDGALLLYNSGFDPGYREASPGLVLLARCIEDAIRDGFREYDFLRGRERYKYDLGGRDRVVYRATVRVS
ncbi:MAG: GNAT family N-acetyltransferase [Deltaproteobacteria bacterium]|nr:GNAT family N-acetyltransferase [Deltaproteobacteria bacterium]